MVISTVTYKKYMQKKQSMLQLLLKSIYVIYSDNSGLKLAIH